MSTTQCFPFNLASLAPFAFDCFALDKNAPKYFGFAELISGLALTLVVWTVADLRYRFRIDTATLPVRIASLVITIVVGILALLTDHWRASQSRVPVGGWLTPESWQLLLGGSFFLVLAVWIWLAFFRPARFNAWNASKFAQTVEMYLLRGESAELVVVGDELARSASRIVSHAPSNLSTDNRITTTQKQALRLLMAIGSPKFCKAVVEGSPRLIINIFNAAREQHKYNDAITIIAKNLLSAAIENRNSFLYSEQDFYSSGLEGITRPVTTALCQSPELVRNIDTLLSPEYSWSTRWDLDQWEAYFRLVLEAFTTHVQGSVAPRPDSLRWAYLHISGIYAELTEDLRLTDLRFNDDLSRRLRAFGTLIKNMVAVLNDIDEQAKPYSSDVLQDIAKLIFSLIEAAASVREPRKVSTRIQKTLIWEEILNSSVLRGEVGQKILQNLHGMLLNSIYQCPNLDSVRLLGYCLHVMGFKPVKKDSHYGSSWRHLHVKLIFWVKRNLFSLLKKYPAMSRYCFVEGMSFDEKNRQLIIRHTGVDESKNSSCYLKLSSSKFLLNRPSRI